MGMGRGLLLWLLGIPLPIILILAIFMHHSFLLFEARESPVPPCGAFALMSVARKHSRHERGRRQQKTPAIRRGLLTIGRVRRTSAR